MTRPVYKLIITKRDIIYIIFVIRSLNNIRLINYEISKKRKKDFHDATIVTLTYYYQNIN